MKQLFTDLAAYHLWADSRLLEAVGLHPELAEREVPGSFPTLKATFEHLLWAEITWLRRLGAHKEERPDPGFRGGFRELSAALLAHNEQIVRWTGEQHAAFFEQMIAYHNSQKQYFRMPVWQCLLQLFNHGTYHRGQVVSMLRQLGLTSIPATDYIVFRRSLPSAQASGTTSEP